MGKSLPAEPSRVTDEENFPFKTRLLHAPVYSIRSRSQGSATEVMTRDQFMTSLRTRLEECNKTGYTLYFRLETFGHLGSGRIYAMAPDVLDSTINYILAMAERMFLHPEETEFYVFDPKRMLSWHVANEDGSVVWYQHSVKNDWVIRDCAKHCAL